MLTILDMLLFFTLAVLLVAIVMQNDKNKKDTLKLQAYSCIVTLSLETVILVIRFMLSKYWAPPLILLIINAIISVDIMLDAKDCGVFEKKKKGNKVNDDIVV